MRVFCAALIVTSSIVASLAGPAFAQDDHVLRYHEAAPDKSPGEIRADKAATRAYQNSLKNIPDQGPVDPWGNARSAAPKTATTTTTKVTKSAAKAAPPKATKTGNTAD